MKIKQKLITGFIAVSLLVGLVGILGLYANNHVVSTYEGGEKHFGTIVEASNEVSSYAKRAQGHLMLYLTLHNETDRTKFYQRLASLREQNSIIEARVKNPEAIKVLSAIKSETDELQFVGESLLKAYDNETKTTGKFVLGNYENLVRKLDDVAARIRSDGLKLSKLEVDLQEEQQSTAKQNAAFLYNIILIISLAAITGALGLGYVFSKIIANPVMELREAAVDIGRGNLGARIEIKSKDEVGELADTFNKMAEGLQKSTAERMQAADALKKSKDFVETVLNSMNDAISVIDVNDFRTIDVNTAFLNTYGLNKEDVIGKTCYEITHKRTGPCNLFDELCPLLETINTGEYSVTEHIHCVRDGEKRYVEVSTSPIKDETGKVISVIHVARDITERKRSEEALRESEERYRRLVEFSPYGIAIHSEGKFVFMNLAGAKILGAANPSLIIGKPLLDIIHPDYHTLIKERIRTLEEGKMAPLVEEKLLRLDGVPVDVEIVTIPFTYQGKPAMYGVFLDITERKKSELEYKTILRTATDGFFVADVQGRILDVNDSYCSMIGYSRDELLNMSIKDLEVVETEAMIVQRIKRIMEVGWDRFETRHKRKDGRIIEIEASVDYLKIGGGKFFVFMRDLTEKKIAEKMRLENERLALASHAKSEFLSVMSHELRTPMNAVLGFSELLKGKMAGELNERQEHFIDNILRSGKRQLGLIEDILDLTLIEAKKLELTIEKVAVPETIEKTIDQIKPSAASRNVLVTKELDPELGFIMADRKRFKQIFSNLLDNAVKFIKPEGGTVTVTSKKEGDMAKFSVSDTGIGIKEEDMEKLFRMFQQVDMGTSRKYGGTGIGLAITKQLVELHGGAILVESRYGEGSTFIFTIPLKDKRRRNNK